MSVISLTRRVYRTLGLKFFDDEEPSPWSLARKLKEIGDDGWGKTEIMLTNPASVLRHIETQDLS